nr:hypothetical protein [Chloroflexota bacterium]
MTQQCIHLSLSVDELALCFSLVNSPAQGRAILSETYGQLTESEIQERLTSASHSLLARKMVTITPEATVKLSPEIEWLLYPLLRYYRVIQVMIMDSEGLPTITNIHLGTNHKFTAHRVEQGVVHLLWHDDEGSLCPLIEEWLLPWKEMPVSLVQEIQNKEQRITLARLAELQSFSMKEAQRALVSDGISALIASELAMDGTRSLKRGSIVFVDASPENIANLDPAQAGPGILFITGEKTTWIFAFEEVNDAAIGQIAIGSLDAFRKVFQDFLQRHDAQ